MASKEEFRNLDRTTKVTVRFLNEGWQEKIRMALQHTKKSSIRDSIAKAFAVLVPHHVDLTHGELAKVIEQIADGTYTLDTAMDHYRRTLERDRPKAVEAVAPSKVSSFLEEMKRANAELCP